MRIHDEAIEVAHGVVDRLEGPARFWWRQRVWEIREIHARWVLTDPWWDSPAARAVRTGDVGPDEESRRTASSGAGRSPRTGSAGTVQLCRPEDGMATGAHRQHGLLTEREVWRVLATRRVLGDEPLVGVFELTRMLPEDRWRLTRVLD